MFPSVPLTDVLEFREGPGILAKDFRDSGVPLLRLAGLKHGAALTDGCNYLDPDMVAAKWRQFEVRLGDTLLSTSASLGEVAVVGEEAVGAVPYTGIIAFRPRDDRFLPEFVRFALVEQSFKDQIAAMGVGSVMKHFGPSHLRQMTVSLPPVREQRAIAEVLGALDDKITANEEVRRLADELRRLTFLTGLDGGVDVPLSQTARFVNGRNFTKEAPGHGRPVIRIAELNSGLGGSTVYNDVEVAENHVARPGDLLFAWSGSLTLRRWFLAEGIVNQHIFKVLPLEGWPLWLVASLLEVKLDEFKAIAADKATTMGHIQRRHLDEPVAVPPDAWLATNGPRLESLWAMALAMEVESQKLAALRDALLPEFMSGRLRVKDAEKTVEEVV
ncbi:restriction endonuclease subunit S [Mobilicoccus sp.]|uniref:restriction endonuclease subunit S n=1 Tax=Mobilicoccus sp. TaxID=2034349 RepID=UPI0028970099|nr:restriction endonuclease subunit S [Mobilicoccus sp.]